MEFQLFFFGKDDCKEVGILIPRIWNFVASNLQQDTALNLSSILCVSCSDVLGLKSISMTSSAKRLILCSVPAIKRPVMSGWDLILFASGSMRSVKIIGDGGHPCLVPFIIGIGLEVIPEVSMVAEGVEYRDRIALCNHPPMPNMSSTVLRYPQWTLSNAFFVSKERSREGAREDPAWEIRLMRHLAPSGAWRPGTKSTWSGWIRCGKICCNLSAKSMAKIFISVLRRDMSLVGYGNHQNHSSQHFGRESTRGGSKIEDGLQMRGAVSLAMHL